MTRIRRLVWMVAFALVLPGAVRGARAQDAPMPAPPSRTPAADLSWQLLPLSGGSLTLDAFRGRVLVVNSWATWCEPCVAELQSLQALRAAIPDSGLQVLLVASEARAPVAAFVARRRVQLPVYLEGSPAPRVYAFDAVPTTWIIDRAGRIAFRRRGAMRWDTPVVRALVQDLLAAPSASRDPGPGGNTATPKP